MNKNHLGGDFIKRISDEALNSTAVNHPYLNAFSRGEFPDMNFAIKDFAYHYGLYNVHFIPYLIAVIDSLSSDKHKQILQSNLDEEKGNVHDVDLPADVLASIDKQSHTQIYRRFQKAVGVDLNQVSSNSDVSVQWSKQFLLLCEKNECAGVGALGIGTELIVSKIYYQILEGLKNYTNLTVSQRVFFDLHSECDDEHAEQLISIAVDLAVNEEACQQIEEGVNSAINMRIKFWDKMLHRALNFKDIDTLETQKAI
ncbi:MAG: iron-containing redox enzyme family protein [Gammaproteobacteria bacterium]